MHAQCVEGGCALGLLQCPTQRKLSDHVHDALSSSFHVHPRTCTFRRVQSCGECAAPAHSDRDDVETRGLAARHRRDVSCTADVGMALSLRPLPGDAGHGALHLIVHPQRRHVGIVRCELVRRGRGGQLSNAETAILDRRAAIGAQGVVLPLCQDPRAAAACMECVGWRTRHISTAASRPRTLRGRQRTRPAACRCSLRRYCSR